ncbi:MAG: cupin domain-containing protein [Paludibacteraceae bacterium]
MSNSSTIVGEKIKSIREAKNLSIEEIAERSGLSVDQVKLIEEEKNLPSLAPLIKIARALGVRLGTFLDDNEGLGPVVCRKSERTEGISFSNGTVDARKNMDYFSLAGNKSGRHIEPFIIDIQPLEGKEFTPSAHEGEEFIYVLEGEIEISYGKESYKLNAGDSIFYDSIVNHHVHGAGSQAAKILAIIYTPI